MQFIVPKAYCGKALRDFIRAYCQVSRAALVKLKKINGGILLNGNCVTVRATVTEGDLVELALEDTVSDQNPYIESIGQMPQIIYEDEAVLAVNKPPYMPTHISHLHKCDTLSNCVSLYMKNKGKPFVFRAINRLDRDTSGIVLIAKNRYYASKLTRSMQNGDIKKEYLAVLCDTVGGNGEIKGYIKREADSIIKRVFISDYCEGADFSHTQYEMLNQNNGYSLVKANPLTGRTHQLRVHFASINASILGDTMYGQKSQFIDRHALHAYKLSFPSPISGDILELYAPLPSDISDVLNKLDIDFPSLIKGEIKIDIT